MAHTLRPLAAVVAALSLSSPLLAEADSMASSTMTNVRLELIDLDTSDGITPSITYTGLTSFATRVFLIADNGDAEVRNGRGVPFLFFPMDVQLSFGPAAAEGRTSPTSLFVTSEARGTVSEASALAQFSAFGFQDPFTFDLTPNTQLVLSADFTGTATAQNICGKRTGNYECEGAFASGSIAFWREGSNDPSVDSLSVSVRATGTSGERMSEADSKSLMVTLTNASAHPIAAGYEFFVSANAITAAPEPGTWALTLGGLAVMLSLRGRITKRT